jgi:diguanylate cyclase (GGDEF)-like protein
VRSIPRLWTTGPAGGLGARAYAVVTAAWWTAAVFTALALVGVAAAGPAGGGGAYHAATAAAAVLVGLRVALVPDRRLGWGLLAAALVCWFGGMLVWDLLGRPAVSWADAPILGAQAIAWAAVVALAVSTLRRPALGLVLDAVGTALAVAAVGVAVAVPAVLVDRSWSPEVGVNLAYPLSDVVLMAAVTAILMLTDGRRGPAWTVLLAGLLAMSAADLGYVVAVAHGDEGGTWAHLLRLLAYLAMAAAAWMPAPALQAPAGRSRWRALGVPAAVLGTGLAVLLVAGLGRVTPAAVLLAAGALVVEGVRTAVLFREARRLQQGLAAAEALAATDPLTGLLNHRAFHDRLAEEVSRSRRTGQPLALVLVDVDHFKQVNDTLGHQAGDGVLVEVARRLQSSVRAEDVLARVGGEEFAWLLPGTDDLAAWEAAERARQLIRARDAGAAGIVTVSAGVTDLRHAGNASDLLRLADGALYWAKDHGRDLVVRYSMSVVTAMSAGERATQLGRAQSLNAMRVLARAVDAKDPYTQAHSERVADMAVRLATALDWPGERMVQLREAALVHDVGKIGVPDGILLKEDRLTDDEHAQVREHSALGARILADVLSDEQVAWVRAHHERWDGGGYPDGLAGDEVPEGARLLAVADAWDAMTSDRPYRAALSHDEALARLRGGEGTQFAPEGVAAMVLLSTAGVLDAVAAEAAARTGREV